MAQLTNEQRQQTYNQFSSETSNLREELLLLKPELRMTVDAIDNWVESNIASFNSAIPQSARAALTTKQKIKLLFILIKQRWEVS